VKILYDIWHAQLMDGDIVRTIRDNIDWIGHFHTGGVPDRHELFRKDELDYRTIAEAIATAGFEGFVTPEWSPCPRNRRGGGSQAVDRTHERVVGQR
jgi:hydroxypyruvate isomerase